VNKLRVASRRTPDNPILAVGEVRSENAERHASFMHGTADTRPRRRISSPRAAWPDALRSIRGRVLALILVTRMWGAAGARLAVSMLARFKICCDHAGALQPIGVMRGR
jgi:hypothetical protein